MNASDAILNTFSTRVRQLILQYKELKAQNARLAADAAKNAALVKKLQAELAQSKKDYQSLKMAKMVTISDSDVESAKARVAKLIREVNKCITLLSEK